MAISSKRFSIKDMETNISSLDYRSVMANGSYTGAIGKVMSDPVAAVQSTLPSIDDTIATGMANVKSLLSSSVSMEGMITKTSKELSNFLPKGIDFSNGSTMKKLVGTFNSVSNLGVKSLCKRS